VETAVNEANWMDVLDEYDQPDELTATVRTVIDDDTHVALLRMRERAPEHKPWEKYCRYSFEDIIEGRC